MNIQQDLLYTKEHEWAKIDGNSAKIGISDYAQSHLGDITFIELPKPEQEVVQFKSCATIESVKAASDIYSPFSGKIVKVNETLNSSPQLINQSPYKDGWIAIIDISQKQEESNLMNASEYRKYAEGLE